MNSIFVSNRVFYSYSVLLYYISTCFNRLDLPNYRSKKDLREKLTIAVKECATGFTME